MVKSTKETQSGECLILELANHELLPCKALPDFVSFLVPSVHLYIFIFCLFPGSMVTCR